MILMEPTRLKRHIDVIDSVSYVNTSIRVEYMNMSQCSQNYGIFLNRSLISCFVKMKWANITTGATDRV